MSIDENRQAGMDEVEITPEMVEAGARVLEEHLEELGEDETAIYHSIRVYFAEALERALSQHE